MINANAPRRGNKPIAQGIALGTREGSMLAFQADIPIVVMVKYHAVHGFCQAVDYFKLTHHYIT